MENENENLDSTNEEEIENTDSQNGEEEQAEEVVDEEKESLRETNKQLFIRLKKAEGFKLVNGEWVKPAPKVAPKPVSKSEVSSDNLSIKDWKALQDVSEEDVDDVVEFAKFKGISVSEAKKHPAVQSLLKTKAEERKTAEATNSGGSRRAVSKNTGEAILERAMSGQLPESDEDIKKLSEARLASKIAAANNRS